jgi:hypothetical protein
MSKRFAFGCTARVGKDTAVEYLIKKYGGVRISFAAPLYRILDFAQAICHFGAGKDRQFLQYVGTEWARAKNPNVWIDLAMEEIRSHPLSTPLFVSDVRFPNEMEALKREGFVLVKIERDDDKKSYFGVGSEQHASETALNGSDKDWDIIIKNNGTLQEFYDKLKHL